MVTGAKDESAGELDGGGQFQATVRFKGMERVFSIFAGAAGETLEQGGIDKFSRRIICASE